MERAANCNCDKCKIHEICPYCNNWKLFCGCVSERCPTCNEHLKISHFVSVCRWDHTKDPCQFCGLPLCENYNYDYVYDSPLNIHSCPNSHFAEDNLCEVCNMPEAFTCCHKHDGTLCKKCGTLLNYGKCIYRCVNGGNRCVHCYREGVFNNKCLHCNKDQTGQLTKAATK